VSIFLCGCATHRQYPSDVYIAEYQSNMLKYISGNDSNNLKEANRNWGMFLKVRAIEVNNELKSN
jgi:hypothetical protein